MLNRILKLERKLGVLDLETTGLDPKEARIVQMAITVHYPDKDPLSWKSVIDPEMPIPNEGKHSVTNDMLVCCTKCHRYERYHPDELCEKFHRVPKFRQVAPLLAPKISEMDICGYNVSNYDVQVLKHEFARAGVEWNWEGHIIDPLQIYRQRRGHTLTNCYLEFGSELGYPIEPDERVEGAHDAGVDVEMTEIALRGQLLRFADLPRTVRELSAFCFPHPENAVDKGGKFVWIGNDAAFNFGKWRGKLVKDPQCRSYLKWLSGADFPDEVLEIARNALQGIYPEKKQ